VGVKVGDAVGNTVGNTDGSAVIIARVGTAVGYTVGVTVGSAVLFATGAAVGAIEGAITGIAVGKPTRRDTTDMWKLTIDIKNTDLPTDTLGLNIIDDIGAEDAGALLWNADADRENMTMDDAAGRETMVEVTIAECPGIDGGSDIDEIACPDDVTALATLDLMDKYDDSLSTVLIKLTCCIVDEVTAEPADILEDAGPEDND
jgi:hypothetical protein